jgi:ATP synthase alpha/beta family, beta-barrel domain
MLKEQQQHLGESVVRCIAMDGESIEYCNQCDQVQT